MLVKDSKWFETRLCVNGFFWLDGIGYTQFYKVSNINNYILTAADCNCHCKLYMQSIGSWSACSCIALCEEWLRDWLTGCDR